MTVITTPREIPPIPSPHPDATRRPYAVTRGLRLGLATACAVFALICLAEAGWIHGKAALAQTLLERAWQRADGSGVAPAPWPWADTRPVARLHAPSLQRSQIVLAGDSGRVLAFGPGWAPASAAPGDTGMIVISGHRDTHFAWLQHVQAGDRLQLETHGGRFDYEVTGMQIVNAEQEHIALDEGGDASLLLVTCWPFDAVASGPLRYTVRAVPVDWEARQ